MAKPLIVSVEAAIASGKSTLLGLVEKMLGMSVYVVQEPVQQWQAIAGNPEHNILDQFYKDTKRWAYSFQSYVFLTRVKAVEEAIEYLRKEGRLETTTILVERSYLTDKETFGTILRENGSISELEWALYESWFDWIVSKSPRFSGHIYMRTSVDTVMQRLSSRNRGEESGISMDYQSKIITKHEQWVARQQAKNVPLVIVNADVDFLADDDHLRTICRQLADFFETLRITDAYSRAPTSDETLRICSGLRLEADAAQEIDWSSDDTSSTATMHENSGSSTSENVGIDSIKDDIVSKSRKLKSGMPRKCNNSRRHDHEEDTRQEAVSTFCSLCNCGGLAADDGVLFPSSNGA